MVALRAMSKQGNSGCRIAALIVAGIVLLFGLVVAGILWMFKAERSHAMEAHNRAVEETAAELRATSAGQDGSLELDAADWESLKPLGEGEPVELKQFVLMMEDPRATDLARETFRQRADGATATWHLRVEDVWSEGGVLGASLSVPYSLKDGNVTRRASLSVRAEFGEGQRDALIGLRQGDAVAVSGTLDLSDDQTRIVDARVVSTE